MVVLSDLGLSVFDPNPKSFTLLLFGLLGGGGGGAILLVPPLWGAGFALDAS